jgi:tetratricopeptide (TPR) repeat protein
VSGGKSARSQSSLGSLLVRRAETKIGLGPTAESRREVEGVGQTVKSLEADYREAMAAFQNAVRLNRMLSSVWFKLGCTALRVEDWPTAATAFRARVDLDQEDYEAWNNLSNACVSAFLFFSLQNSPSPCQSFRIMYMCDFLLSVVLLLHALCASRIPLSSPRYCSRDAVD